MTHMRNLTDSSVKSQKLTEIQTKLRIKHARMIRFSDTRWNCRYRNIESVKNSYKLII
jgi:hypothetical protein